MGNFDHHHAGCGYWTISSWPPGAIVVVQQICEGPWLRSVAIGNETPNPMKYWKVSKGEPSEIVEDDLMTKDVLEHLSLCAGGGIDSIPAVIETVRGTERWSDYRYVKVPSVLSHDDLWSGKGSAPIYTIPDGAGLVVSTKVRRCLEAKRLGLRFDEPSLLE